MIHYYIEKKGRVVGPLDAAGLKNKNILATTLVWRHGLNNWIPARDLEELVPLFSQGPPPLPGREPVTLLSNATKKGYETTKRDPNIPPLYDKRYCNENDATYTGVFILMIPLFFLFFYNRAVYRYEHLQNFKILFYAVAIIFRLIAVSWVMQIAGQQNRDPRKWGIAALLFPGIILIIIGQRKKLYDASEWRKHLYDESRFRRLTSH